MARRSRRRTRASDRLGGLYLRPSELVELPRAHESVRRYYESQLSSVPRARAVSRTLSVRAYRDMRRMRYLLSPAKPAKRSKAMRGIAFKALRVVEPARVLMCVRRGIRREVLHALGIAGSRGLGRGGVRRTVDSAYSC